MAPRGGPGRKRQCGPCSPERQVHRQRGSKHPLPAPSHPRSPGTQPCRPARSAWRKLYASRSGAEGEIAEFTGTHRARRCRHRGLAKTHVHPDGPRCQRRTAQPERTRSLCLPAAVVHGIPAVLRRPPATPPDLVVPRKMTLTAQDSRQCLQRYDCVSLAEPRFRRRRQFCGSRGVIQPSLISGRAICQQSTALRFPYCTADRRCKHVLWKRPSSVLWRRSPVLFSEACSRAAVSIANGCERSAIAPRLSFLQLARLDGAASMRATAGMTSTRFVMRQ